MDGVRRGRVGVELVGFGGRLVLIFVKLAESTPSVPPQRP